MPVHVPIRNHLIKKPLGEKLSQMVLKKLKQSPPELFIAVDFPAWQIHTEHPVFHWLRNNYEPFPQNQQPLPFLFHYRRGGMLEKRIKTP